MKYAAAMHVSISPIIPMASDSTVITVGRTELAIKGRSTIVWGSHGCTVVELHDQALLLENRMLDALRRFDDLATLAHLAYMTMLKPPMQNQLHFGICLEFSPIVRSWQVPLSRREEIDRLGEHRMTHGNTLGLLQANLNVFGTRGAQVLE